MDVAAAEATQTLLVHRWDGDNHVAIVYRFGDAATWCASLPAGVWRVLLDSADEQWHGPGSRVESQIASDGRVSLSLLPKQVVVLGRELESP